ncbi:MAG: type II secretion system protein GspK [Candidatus Saelkia tenebricola]|nr:type II secretion system protein GspK [Candidatus Saelkia tenebricola]
MNLNKQNKQGQVSIIILWAMMFFVFIILSFAKRASHEMRMVLSTKEKVQGNFLIWDAFKTMERLLKSDDREVDSLQDRWARLEANNLKTCKKDGNIIWEIMDLYDEESLININEIGPEVLKTIFAPTASALSYPEYYLCLLDWLDEDDLPSQDPDYPGYIGAEKDNIFYEDRDYYPRNGHMRSLYELFLVKGAQEVFFSSDDFALKEQKINNFAQTIIPSAYACCGAGKVPVAPPPPLIPWPIDKMPGPGENPFGELSPTGIGFTVYGDGKININTAPHTVLQAVGFLPDTVVRLLTFRFGGGIFKQNNSGHIINQLITADCLRNGEPTYNTIASNIGNVIGEGNTKVQSNYFRIRIKSTTKKGIISTTIMVLKREEVEDEVKIKIIAWWENFYL